MSVNKIYPVPDLSKLHLAREFHSVDEFFNELQKAKIRYVVLRGWELIPNLELGGNSDLDLLVQEEDLPLFYSLSGAITPNAQLSIRLCLVRIADSYLKIDVRSPHDGYLPLQLAEKMLQTRIREKNFSIPEKQMFFWSYLYHRVFQKPILTDEHVKKLRSIAPESFPIVLLRQRDALCQLFVERGWEPSRPLDEWVWWVYRDNSVHYPEWQAYEETKDEK